MLSRADTKQRLLFLRKTDSFGGADVLILDYLRRIDYRRSTVLFAASVDFYSTLFSKIDLPIAFVPITARFDGGFVFVVLSWIKYLRRLRPNKIILTEGGFREFALAPALAAYFVARGNVWLMELHPAPTDSRENAGMHRRLIPLSIREAAKVSVIRGVLSPSNGVKDRLVRVYGYPPEKINVVPHGVDTRHFVPASRETRRLLRTALGITDDAIVVVSTARLVPTKRLDRLIRAFGTLGKGRDDLYLFLTGDGPERRQLESLTRSMPNCEHVRFLGHVRDVAPLLQASDIYVLPSDEEAFGISLVEAMACQLVCVSTKTVGPCEILDHEVTGFLTDVSYAGVLVGLKRALMLREKERGAIGQRARLRVVAKFDIVHAVSKGLRLLEVDSAAQEACEP